MALLSIIALASAATQAASGCAAYQGQTINPVPITQVFASLPTTKPKDQYESTADYRRRLEASQSQAPAAPLVIDRPWDYKPPYDADKGVLTISDLNFGWGFLDFRAVLSLGSSVENAIGNIGFEVTRKNVGQSAYEANNGFGAKITVTRVEQAIDAIWERPLKGGEGPFVGAKPFRPLRQLSLSSSEARDIIEGGGAAIVAKPKPPFTQFGSTSNAPSFSNPRETLKVVRVLWADVQCVLVYDRLKRVVVTLEVK